MGADTWQPLFDRCGRSLDQIAPGLHDDIDTALAAVLGSWNAEAFDHCAVHADLFPDNVLMRGDAVSGLIDFYFACNDIRAFDLAIMHSAWAFDAAGTMFDADVGNALIDGYEAAFGLLPAERAAFTVLAKGACLRFFLSRAWDWLNTPADALVTRKDPMAYMNRYAIYAALDGRMA